MNPPGDHSPVSRPVRVAFFGGSFDPPHRGHLAIARAAADRFQLDRVLFAPVGRQPLKSGAHQPPIAQTPFADRLAMVELACQADPRFAPSSLDAPRPDGLPNYTVDTLTTLRNSLASADQLFCLVGADSFRDLPRWRDPERLLALCEWIVVSRPGIPLPPPPRPTIPLPPVPLPRIPLPTIQGEVNSRIHRLDSVYEEVSATEIRNSIIRNSIGSSHPATGVVPPGVEQYIREHHLYR